MTTFIPCLHSGYITVTMTPTATAIVQTALAWTTTVTTDETAATRPEQQTCTAVHVPTR